MFIKIVAFCLLISLALLSYVFFFQAEDVKNIEVVVDVSENKLEPHKEIKDKRLVRQDAFLKTESASEVPELVDEPLPEDIIYPPQPVERNSLAEARINGDPRTPPIVRSSYEREMPTPEELADPDMYHEYEVRQNQKVYVSFYKESKKKIEQMEALVSRAKKEGVPEEKIREGEEKIAAMKAMREQLREEHEELADESYK